MSKISDRGPVEVERTGYTSTIGRTTATVPHHPLLCNTMNIDAMGRSGRLEEAEAYLHAGCQHRSCLVGADRVRKVPRRSLIDIGDGEVHEFIAADTHHAESGIL